jgi:hypothetical protein
MFFTVRFTISVVAHLQLNRKKFQLSEQGHTVNALAQKTEEGRGRLR